MNYFHIRIVSITILVFCYVKPCFTQIQNVAIFSAIPETQRARLVERLNLLVEYQKMQQWDKQYDLLRSFITRAEGKQDFINRTKQAYTKWGRLPLSDFTPYKIKSEQADANTKFWLIMGCSELLDKGKKVHKFAAVEAHREKNDWFFSELQNYGDGDEQDPCSVKSRLPQKVGFVNDFADVIDSEAEVKIDKMLKDLLDKNKIELFVVTVKTTGEDTSSAYILSLIRLWGLGADTPDRASAILFITVNNKEWEIKVNRPFQTVLSGEEVSRLTNKMSTPFSEGRFGDGITNFLEAFVKKLNERTGEKIVARFSTK